MNPAELLQHLIRFDTTNPPGNEAACMAYIAGLLRDAGIETTILEKAPGRPNLIARLKGTGAAPPFLMYGHVDVVTTAGQNWTHPPFAGEVADGFIWGRGTLDMKGGVAMMLAAFLRLKTENVSLAGDVILCIVCDEEVSGDYGANFLVQEHASLFTGVKHAIGEFGGFTLYVAGKRFYPIMVAEKQFCNLKFTLRGSAGHGSMPIKDGAMARLGQVLTTLNKKRLPVHILPIVQQMFHTIADHISFPTSLLMRQLTNPPMTDRVLDLLGERGYTFNPLLHNTVSPTIIHASDKVNVIPGEVSLELDGRLLPGFQPDDILHELRSLLGDGIDYEVTRYDPGPSQPDMTLFDLFSDTLKARDPQGIPLPLMLSGVTDGRYFAQLGIQTYGFLPMQLPPDFNFARTIHAADERIPVGAVAFGADAIYAVLCELPSRY